MRALGVILSLALFGCSGSSTIDGGAGGSTATGMGTAGAGVGGTGAGGGTGAAGGNTGTGGAGGQPDCPDISCSMTCPSGTWPELDGCPSCACASELEMEIRGAVRPSQLVSVDTAVTDFVGAIDRWIFDFTWHYDDPAVSDDAEDVAVSVAIMRLDPAHEPTETNTTWYYPEDTGMPFESRGATYTLHGFGVIQSDLVLDEGFLSIRRSGDTFEGHAYFDLSIVGGTGADTVYVADPFSVPVP